MEGNIANMGSISLEKLIFFVVVAIGLIVVLITLAFRVPKPLRIKYFSSRWQELMALCKEKDTWPKVLREADLLLDKALKKRKFKGKTMGERMVSAQRVFSENDAAWFAHNLQKKFMASPNAKLSESDLKSALVGFRQALRDLGALPDGNSQSKDS